MHSSWPSTLLTLSRLCFIFTVKHSMVFTPLILQLANNVHVHFTAQVPPKSVASEQESQYGSDLRLGHGKVSKEGGGDWERKKHKCHLLFKEVSDDHQEKGIWNCHVQMGSFNKDEPIMIFKI